jgi:hypothetical protein
MDEQDAALSRDAIDGSGNYRIIRSLSPWASRGVWALVLIKKASLC